MDTKTASYFKTTNQAHRLSAINKVFIEKIVIKRKFVFSFKTAKTAIRNATFYPLSLNTIFHLQSNPIQTSSGNYTADSQIGSELRHYTLLFELWTRNKTPLIL